MWALLLWVSCGDEGCVLGNQLGAVAVFFFQLISLNILAWINAGCVTEKFFTRFSNGGFLMLLFSIFFLFERVKFYCF